MPLSRKEKDKGKKNESEKNEKRFEREGASMEINDDCFISSIVFDSINAYYIPRNAMGRSIFNEITFISCTHLENIQ